MSERIKCTYCESIVDACQVCGEPSPLLAQLAEARERIKELEETTSGRALVLLNEENDQLHAQLAEALSENESYDDTMTIGCRRITELEAKLAQTVTTAYHDELMQLATNERVALSGALADAQEELCDLYRLLGKAGFDKTASGWQRVSICNIPIAIDGEII